MKFILNKDLKKKMYAYNNVFLRKNDMKIVKYLKEKYLLNNVLLEKQFNMQKALKHQLYLFTTNLVIKILFSVSPFVHIYS